MIGPGRAAGALADGMPTYCGGVWHRDATALPLARHFESGRCILTPAPPLRSLRVERLAGTWLYGGVLREKFGHFLTESLARLWALDLPDLGKIDGVIWSGVEEFGLPPFVLPILDHIDGLPPARFAIAGALQPDRLILPRQEGGSGVGLFLSPALAAGLRRRFARPNGPSAPGGTMIYVSRSAMAKDPLWIRDGTGHLMPGPEVDQAFQRAGYHVFHPEAVSLSEQIETYRSADVLVMDEGSPLHLAGLVVRPEVKMVVLCRRPHYRMLFEAHLRILLGRAADVTVRMVEGEARRNANGISVKPDPAKFADLLRSANLPPVLL